MTVDATVVSAHGALARRLRPIYVAAFLQNVALWVPIVWLVVFTLVAVNIGIDDWANLRLAHLGRSLSVLQAMAARCALGSSASRSSRTSAK